MINAKSAAARARKRAEQDRRLWLEIDQLERRRMLAGNVTTSLLGGSLIIDGDAQDNLLAMTQINGDLVLVGIDTAIEDADLSTSLLGIDIDLKLIDGVTRDVTAILRGGDDVFLVGGGVDGIDFDDVFGSGDPSFGPAEFQRDLKIFTNGGRDTVVVTGAEIGRNLVIDTGFGQSDTVVVGGGGVALAVLDALQDVDLFTTSALGFEDGDGLSETIGEIINALLGSVDVGRDMLIVGHSSDDSVYVGGANIGRDATILTGLQEDEVYFGTGAVIEIFAFDIEPRLELTGFLEAIEVSSFVSVGRNTVINTGDADDVARIGGAVNFDFFFDHDGGRSEGGSADFIFVLFGGVDVENNFTLNTANNDDDVYIGVKPRFVNFEDPTAELGAGGRRFDVSVGRDMIILTLNDDDLVQIGGSDGFVGDFWFGDGEEGVLEVGRNLIINTGAGTDDVLMGETEPLRYFPDAAAEGEGDGDGFYLIDVGRDLTILTGLHDDNVEIAGHYYIDNPGSADFGPGFFDVGTLRVGRNMVLSTDGGNDNVSMAFNEFIDGPVIRGDGWSDEFAAIYIGRDLKILTGDQDDTVEIDLTYVGDDAIILTGWGRDLLDIGSCTVSPISVMIGDQLKIITDLERDTIGIAYTYVGGKTLIATGLRDDEVNIEYSQFGDDLKVTTGRGNDEVNMEDVSVDGDIRVLTQQEDDTVNIFETVASRLFVLTADGEDQVCVIDSMFSNGATLDGGRGDFDALGHNLLSPVIKNFEEVLYCGQEEE